MVYIFCDMYSAIKYDNTVYITYMISYYALYGENIFLIDLDRYIYIIALVICILLKSKNFHGSKLKKNIVRSRTIYTPPSLTTYMISVFHQHCKLIPSTNSYIVLTFNIWYYAYILFYENIYTLVCRDR